MLTQDIINYNKNRVLDLVNQIDIPGSDIQGLLSFLEESDYFYAPASTQYHNGFEGGLCDHSLHVYDTLKELTDRYYPNKFDKSSIIVVALFHDLSKTNFYEKTTINKKIYSEKGMKQDNQGRFDWFAEEVYKVKDIHTRFIAGEHGLNSLMLLSKYIPLNLMESVAVINHMFVTDNKQLIPDISAIYDRYPLAGLLFISDMISTVVLENMSGNKPENV